MNSNNVIFLKKILSARNITHTILVVFLVLMPLFFIPSLFITPAVAKSVFVSIATIIALVSYGVVLIQKKSFSFVKSPITFGSLVLLVACFASSVFSTSLMGSFFGYGFEIATFRSIVLGLVLLHLVAISFNDVRKLFAGHIAFLSVAALLAVFQTILMLTGGNGYTGQGVFSFMINTIGKTNELALFFSVSVIMSLVALETLRLNKLYRLVLYVLISLSFVVIAIINFLTAWYLLGFVLLAFFLYHIIFLASHGTLSVVSSESRAEAGDLGAVSETHLQSSRKKIPTRVVIFLVLSLIFIVPSFFGVNIARGLSEKFSFNSFEVRPSWESTGEILKGSISQFTLMGPGLNRFSTQWQLFRPDVNMSEFWAMNFDFGIGYIPTMFVETGIVGSIGWLVFLLSILYVGFRAMSVRTTDYSIRYLVASSFFVTLFLWLSNIVYTPTSVMFVLSFFFAGLFLASAVLAGMGSTTTISYIGRKKAGIVVTIVSVCVIVASLGLAYTLLQSAHASVFFQKANSAIVVERSIEKAENFIFQAIDIAPNDIYYRMIVDLSLARIKNLLEASAGRSEVTDAEKTEFQNALQNAVQAAQLANGYDARNFQNKAIAAQVYETIIPVQIEGAYEMAKKLYEEAVALSPRNPALFLALARVDASRGAVVEAENYIQKALELKWNYPDAIFLQSQIDVSKGNIPVAIQAVQQIASLTPNDPLIFFRLGLLQYEAKNFTQAITAFEKSISLVPVYANAKYFLGLSYVKARRNTDAIRIFTELQTTNPEVPEISEIISNLQAGKDPFGIGAENIDPEKRTELPLTETGSSENP